MGVAFDVPSHEVTGQAADAVRRALGTDEVSYGLSSAVAGPDLSVVMDEQVEVRLDAVDGLPAAWSGGSAGRFVAGFVAGRTAVAWTCPVGPAADPAASAFGTRVAVELGVHTFVLAATATPLNPVWLAGGVGLVADHINVSGSNPLVGPNFGAYGPRFPDMSFVYDAALRRQARTAALFLGMQLLEGMLACVPDGHDDKSDQDLLRSLGADASSSGVAADAIVARHAGRRVLGFLDVRGAANQPAADAAGYGELVRRTIDAEEEVVG